LAVLEQNVYHRVETMSGNMSLFTTQRCTLYLLNVHIGHPHALTHGASGNTRHGDGQWRVYVQGYTEGCTLGVVHGGVYWRCTHPRPDTWRCADSVPEHVRYC